MTRGFFTWEITHSRDQSSLIIHNIKQYWLVFQCGWIMGWSFEGGRTVHDALCLPRPVKLFIVPRCAFAPSSTTSRLLRVSHSYSLVYVFLAIFLILIDCSYTLRSLSAFSVDNYCSPSPFPLRLSSPWRRQAFQSSLDFCTELGGQRCISVCITIGICGNHRDITLRYWETQWYGCRRKFVCIVKLRLMWEKRVRARENREMHNMRPRSIYTRLV